MWILITAIAALVVLAVSMDASWSNVLSPSRNDLVFENRVKEYGAFMLRKEEPRNLLYAMFLGVGLLLLGAVGLSISKDALPSNVSGDIITEWLALPPIPQTDDQATTEDQDKQDEDNSTDTGAATSGEQQQDTTPTVVDDATEVVDPEVPVDPVLLGGGGTTDGPSLGGDGRLSGNNGSETGTELVPPPVPDWAEFMPQFPGREAAMLAFMKKHISLSERDKDIGASGTLWITFVVRKTGEITDVRVLRSLGQKTDVEVSAVRAAQKMPQWNPGRMGDTPVDVRMTMPVRVEVRY